MTVTFRIEPKPEWYSARAKAIHDAWLNDNSNEGFNASVQPLRRQIEPALGPSLVKILSVNPERKDDRSDVAIIFHPQDYLAGKTRAAKKASEV